MVMMAAAVGIPIGYLPCAAIPVSVQFAIMAVNATLVAIFAVGFAYSIIS